MITPIFGSIVQKELKETASLVALVEDHSNLAVKGVNVVLNISSSLGASSCKLKQKEGAPLLFMVDLVIPHPLSSVIINEDSDDVDFRVESNGNTHMLFVDGGNNEVGINTSAAAATLGDEINLSAIRQR